MTPPRSPSHSTTAIYRMPFVIALISALGLASALFGDGLWDVWSWLGLGLPIVIAAVHWRRSAKPSSIGEPRR